MKYPKRSQYKYAKSRYGIRNWPQYEAGLRSRGDLTVWLSDAAPDAWRPLPSGKPGGQLPMGVILSRGARTPAGGARGTKRLRPYLLYNRALLGDLSRVAARTITAFIRTTVGERGLSVGIVASIQTHVKSNIEYPTRNLE